MNATSSLTEPDRRQGTEALASVVRECARTGLHSQVNGVTLEALAETPQALLDHLQRFSVLKAPEDWRRLFSRALSTQLEGSTSGDTVSTLAQSLYEALLDQQRLLARYSAARPFRIAMFRGGRGASALTDRLTALPNVVVDIVLGATDDGRSWYVAASDFNATGVPDAGKSLLDLARDERVKGFLGERLRQEHRDLADEFSDLMRKAGGATDVSLSTQCQALFERLMAIDPVKRDVLVAFLRHFHQRYRSFASRFDPTKRTEFSFHNIPMRSLALVGAAWQFNDDWQRAADAMGELLDIAPHRVLFPTGERQHLMGMTADGMIYFTETGINEHPKRADYLGLWLVDEMPDIDAFATRLRDREGIALRSLIDADLAGMPEADHALRTEVIQTTRAIVDPDGEKLKKVALQIAALSRTAQARGGEEIAALPDARTALREADLILYAPTTLESNMGSALIVPGLQQAIGENTRAVRVHFVNPTFETDRPGTTALDMVTRLARWASGQQSYLEPEVDWARASAYVDYVVGIGEAHPRRDPKKVYIPFSVNEVSACTGGRVVPVAMDLEIGTPIRKQRKDYSGYDEEYGFYDATVMTEAALALAGIHKLGARLTGDGALVLPVGDAVEPEGRT